MVPVGGSALWCIAVLWSLAAFTALFVCLRLYTRLKVVDAYGLDDHFFNAAFVSLCCDSRVPICLSACVPDCLPAYLSTRPVSVIIYVVAPSHRLT